MLSAWETFFTSISPRDIFLLSERENVVDTCRWNGLKSMNGNLKELIFPWLDKKQSWCDITGWSGPPLTVHVITDPSSFARTVRVSQESHAFAFFFIYLFIFFRYALLVLFSYNYLYCNAMLVWPDTYKQNSELLVLKMMIWYKI